MNGTSKMSVCISSTKEPPVLTPYQRWRFFSYKMRFRLKITYEKRINEFFTTQTISRIESDFNPNEDILVHIEVTFIFNPFCNWSCIIEEQDDPFFILSDAGVRWELHRNRCRQVDGLRRAGNLGMWENVISKPVLVIVIE